MKKLLSLAAAGAMLLSVAAPSFAGGMPPMSGNAAVVNQSVSSTAYSGSNSQSGFMGTKYMVTGDNVCAVSTGVVVANTKVGGMPSGSNFAMVGQGVGSTAYSGSNSQTGLGGSQTLVTGSNVGSQSTGVTVVNTSLSWGFPRR